MFLQHYYMRKSSVSSGAGSRGPFDHRASSIQNMLLVGRKAPPSTDTPILMLNKHNFWPLDTASQCCQNMRSLVKTQKLGSQQSLMKPLWQRCQGSMSNVDRLYNFQNIHTHPSEQTDRQPKRSLLLEVTFSDQVNIIPALLIGQENPRMEGCVTFWEGLEKADGER